MCNFYFTVSYLEICDITGFFAINSSVHVDSILPACWSFSYVLMCINFSTTVQRLVLLFWCDFNHSWFKWSRLFGSNIFRLWYLNDGRSSSCKVVDILKIFSRFLILLGDSKVSHERCFTVVRFCLTSYVTFHYLERVPFLMLKTKETRQLHNFCNLKNV